MQWKSLSVLYGQTLRLPPDYCSPPPKRLRFGVKQTERVVKSGPLESLSRHMCWISWYCWPISLTSSPLTSGPVLSHSFTHSLLAVWAKRTERVLSMSLYNGLRSACVADLLRVSLVVGHIAGHRFGLRTPSVAHQLLEVCPQRSSRTSDHWLSCLSAVQVLGMWPTVESLSIVLSEKRSHLLQNRLHKTN